MPGPSAFALLLIVLPSLLLAVALPRIEVYSRFADLLPTEHPYIQTYNRLKQTFGGANVVAMSLEVVGEGDIFTAATLDKIRYLTDQVDLIPGVNHYQVASIADPKIRRIRTTASGLIKSEPVLPKDLPTEAEALKQLREESFNNDIVYGTYLSTDSRAALLVAGFDEERLNYLDIHTKLQTLKNEVEKDGKTRLYIAGEPMLKGWIYYYSHELAKIFAVTGIVMVLLAFHFGSVTGVLVPTLGTALSAVWGLGFVGFMHYNLDPLILVVPILISARTASHCVQMMERFYDEIRVGRDKESAVRIAMGELILPAGLGILADAMALLALALSSMPLIAKLGYAGRHRDFDAHYRCRDSVHGHDSARRYHLLDPGFVAALEQRNGAAAVPAADQQYDRCHHVNPAVDSRVQAEVRDELARRRCRHRTRPRPGWLARFVGQDRYLSQSVSQSRDTNGALRGAVLFWEVIQRACIALEVPKWLRSPGRLYTRAAEIVSKWQRL